MVYNPKTTSLKELAEERNLGIKSKIKYQGYFKEELEELVGKLEGSIRKEIITNYGVGYTQYGDQIIKIKIKDKNLMVEKLITCALFYNKNDETYGYVTPLFSSEEKSQKTKKHELRKFSLSDKEEIVKAIVVKLIDVIEEF